MKTKRKVFLFSILALFGVTISMVGGTYKVADAETTKITDVKDIVSGKQYYIGATTGEKESAKDWYFNIDASAASSSNKGNAVDSKASATLLTFTKNTSGLFSLKFDSGLYLSLKNKKENGVVVIQEAEAFWTVTNSGNLLNFKINGYCLQRNNTATNLIFGSYASGQKNVWLEEYVAGVTNLSAPKNINVTDKGLATWDAVTSAVSYTYKVDDGSETTTTDREYQIDFTKLTIGEHTFSVKANGNGTTIISSVFGDLTFLVPDSRVHNKIIDPANIISGARYNICAEIDKVVYYLNISGNGSTINNSVSGTGYSDYAKAQAFTFTNTQSGWTIQFDNGNYIGLKNSKDNGKVIVSTEPNYFKLAIDTSNKLLKILNTAGSYSIQKNNTGSTNFGSYGNTQTNVWIELVPTDLLAPTNFAYDEGTFTWTASERATKYELTIDENDPFIIDGATTKVIDENDYSMGHHSAKIRAIGDGVAYINSTYATVDFTIPFQLLAPTNVQFDEGVVSWDAVTNAVSYDVIVDGNEPINVTNTSKTLDLAEGNHTVKVRAVGDDEVYLTSDYSSEHKFVISVQLPTPTNAIIDDDTYTWDRVTNATKYSVQIDEKTPTLTTELFYEIDKTKLSVGNHEIKVKAIGDGTIYLDSEYTTTSKFVVSTKLAVPTNVTYKSNVLSWDAVTNATTYQVQLDDNPVTSTAETSKTIDTTGLSVGTHTLKVRALGDGVVYLVSDFSKEVEFIISTDLQVPTNLVYTNGVLSWNAVSNAISYQVQIDNDAPITATTNSLTIDTTKLTVGDHKVKVKAMGNQFYLTSDYSEPIDFIVNVQLESPANITYSNNLLTWSENSHAVKYLVQVDENEPVEVNTNSYFINKDTLATGTHLLNVKAIGDGIYYLDSEYGSTLFVEEADYAKEFKLINTMASLRVNYGCSSDQTRFDFKSGKASMLFGIRITKNLYDEIMTGDATFGIMYGKLSSFYVGMSYSVANRLNSGAKMSDIAVNGLKTIEATPVRVDENGNENASGYYYQWGVSINNITAKNYNTYLNAVAYICVDGTYYFAKERGIESVKSLAQKYVDAADTSAYTDSLPMLNALANFVY